MQRARAFGLAVGALGVVLGLGGCGEDGQGCAGASCGGGSGGMGGAGGASGMGGQGGTSGAGGSGGTGGAGAGGTGGTMEPPIMGPAPTACVPHAVPSSDLESVLTVLYTGSEQLDGLALRRSDLFVRDGQGILRLSDGTTSLARVTTANVNEMLAADLRLYWVDAGSLYRVDFDANGDMPERVASNLQSPATLLRHDEENVFYVHASSSSVWRQPLDGSAAVQLATGAAASDLAVEGGSVYYASGQAVKRIVVETGATSDVLTDAPRAVTDIETDGVDLVWTDGVEIFGVEIDGAAMRKPLTQAGPSATGAAQSRIEQIVLHGSAVYFLDAAGNAGMALLNGSRCELIVGAVEGARAIAVDDEYLYLNKRDAAGSQLWRIEL